MDNLLKRMKTNALLSAALYALLGLVLLIWPALSASLLCLALGLVLVLCGLSNIFVFLRSRDGSLYAALHLITGVVLAAVGIWLMARPTLVTVVIPRIVGVLICFHGFRDIGDAIPFGKTTPPAGRRHCYWQLSRWCWASSWSSAPSRHSPRLYACWVLSCCTTVSVTCGSPGRWAKPSARPKRTPTRSRTRWMWNTGT